jgi:hypothetical protein
MVDQSSTEPGLEYETEAPSSVRIAPLGASTNTTRDYLTRLAHEMGGRSTMTSDKYVWFTVQDPADGRVTLRLSCHDGSVLLEQTTGSRAGQRCLIAGCKHLLSR